MRNWGDFVILNSLFRNALGPCQGQQQQQTCGNQGFGLFLCGGLTGLQGGGMGMPQGFGGYGSYGASPTYNNYCSCGNGWGGNSWGQGGWGAQGCHPPGIADLRCRLEELEALLKQYESPCDSSTSGSTTSPPQPHPHPHHHGHHRHHPRPVQHDTATA